MLKRMPRGSGRSAMSHVAKAAGTVALAILFLSGFQAVPPAALTLEQAKEQCKESVGRALVKSCVMSKGGPGAGALEACIVQATPQVRACVLRTMNAANGRANVAVPLPPEPRPDPAPAKAGATAQADEQVRYVVPPRTIADVTAILDAEKPDPKRFEELKARADAKAPSGGSAEQLGRFYYDRASARAQLGRLADAISDTDKAVEHARNMGDRYLRNRVRQFAGVQYQAAGNPKAAVAVSELLIKDTHEQWKGYQIGVNLRLSAIYVQLGDVAQAEAYLRRNLALIQEARTSGMPLWREAYPLVGQWFESNVEHNRGIVLEARGQLRQAEEAYRLSERRGRAGIPSYLRYRNPPPVSELQSIVDARALDLARMKLKQGRLAEAEVDARRALLSQLKSVGKYDSYTPRFVMGLAAVLTEQGRLDEAEKLIRAALEIIDTIGVVEGSQVRANILSGLGRVLNLARKTREADAVYDQLESITAKWEPRQREATLLTNARIYSLYDAHRFEAGIAAAETLLKREIARVGEKHFDTAAIRGALAIGLARAGRDGEAIREFKSAIPVMLSAVREAVAQEDDLGATARRGDRFADVVEAYIGLLARQGATAEVAAETFQLGDAIRSRSVQGAVSASAARMVASDKGLADLVRREQDLEKQVGAHLGLLNNVLSLPSGQRDDGAVPRLNAEINRLRSERSAARSEIATRFPNYAELIDPKSPSVDQIRSALRSGEAFVAFHLGRQHSFAWAVPKEGPVGFAPIGSTAGEIDAKVEQLRRALAPDFSVSREMPPFDVTLAYDLYRLLLAPVEASWKGASSLIVSTNGSLGLLPLSLLPTAEATVETREDVKFESYRKVPWLARTHAVSVVPSAAALRTLRQLPPGSASREPLIGFGDPLFSAAQAALAAPDAVLLASAERSAAPRLRAAPGTARFDTAELSRLASLPDTAEELKAIARALGVDPATALHLGKSANEAAVKRADLTRYRIVAFSTHGLLPGDLNGLMQPALALSAPEVAGVDGDGLLTMEEILALKLDADWVLLSACNTGAGASSEAEALSGLGRAFFYAGARALLVTNWSVDSVSARELVTDVFRRQSADPLLGRSEALRRAMMALADSGHVEHDGKPVLSYAHPIYWAPYSVIGEGSR